MAKYLLVYHGGGMAEGEAAQAEVDGSVGNLVPEPRAGARRRRQSRSVRRRPSRAMGRFLTEVAQTPPPATA